jgi:hypothetical protein
VCSLKGLQPVGVMGMGVAFVSSTGGGVTGWMGAC